MHFKISGNGIEGLSDKSKVNLLFNTLERMFVLWIRTLKTKKIHHLLADKTFIVCVDLITNYDPTILDILVNFFDFLKTGKIWHARRLKRPTPRQSIRLTYLDWLGWNPVVQFPCKSLKEMYIRDRFEGGWHKVWSLLDFAKFWSLFAKMCQNHKKLTIFAK